MNILEKLHEIEKEKIIYNIHYCRAGVGIIFYCPEKAQKYLPTKEDILPNNWRKGLSVETYYPSFEEAIEAEYNKIKE